DYAHGCGIIHRDVKPANILVEGSLSRGLAKLCDFGIALQIRISTLGAAMGMAGTPLYMAPEQLRRQRTDHRVDIYSLAVTLYQALSGVTPFRSEAEIHTATVQPIAGLTERQQRALLRALSRNPDERPGSAMDLVREMSLEADALVAWRAGTR